MENEVFNLIVRSQIQTMENLDKIFDALTGIKEDLAEIDRKFAAQHVVEETKTTVSEVKFIMPERNL